MTELFTMLQSTAVLSIPKAVIIAVSACVLGLIVSSVYILTS